MFQIYSPKTRRNNFESLTQVNYTVYMNPNKIHMRFKWSAQKNLTIAVCGMNYWNTVGAKKEKKIEFTEAFSIQKFEENWNSIFYIFQ